MKLLRAQTIALLGIGALLSALPALAEDAGAETDAGAAAAADSDAGAVAPAGAEADAGAIPPAPTCIEQVPEGASRPKLVEVFPERGTSGWAVPLEITVMHGKGETVIPPSFQSARKSDHYQALEEAGFVLPDPDGGAGPAVSTEATETASTTKLTISFVPLPKNGGRNVMMLPPVPITIARASGDLVTVCTAPHPILVEDPIVNELDPKVRPNPDGRPQREEWVLAKQVAIGALIGGVITAILAWLYVRWSRRPKPEPYVAPKLPWIEALEELEAVRTSTLIAEGKTDVYFDRVSDCVRKYLGARYGFDGLESTTHEMEKTLARVRPAVRGLDTISRFLEECDLVKFARVVPTENDCLAALERGVTIVRNTTPASASRQTTTNTETGGAE